MSTEDIRWEHRFAQFKNALRYLEEDVELARSRKLSRLEAQGLVHGFEYTHDLAWKTLQDQLEDEGVSEIYGSKDATRTAFKLGIIRDGEAWMEMIKHRVLSSQIYDEPTTSLLANQIVTNYAAQFQQLRTTLEGLEGKAPR